MTGRGRGFFPQRPPAPQENVGPPVGRGRGITPSMDSVGSITQGLAGLSVGMGRSRGTPIRSPLPTGDVAGVGIGAAAGIGVGIPFVRGFGQLSVPQGTVPGARADEMVRIPQSVGTGGQRPGPSESGSSVQSLASSSLGTEASLPISECSVPIPTTSATGSGSTGSAATLRRVGSGAASAPESGSAVAGSALATSQTPRVIRNDSPSVVTETPVADQIVRRGTKGTPVRVMTNFLVVKLATDKGIYEYHTTFEPALDSTLIRKKVVRSLGENLGEPRTFDGMKLMLPYELGPQSRTIECEHPNEPGMRLRLNFTLVKKASIGESSQFYNVLLRKVMADLEYTEMNRNFYDPKASHQMPNHNLEIWPGYVTAIEEYQGGLMLCLDSVHRVLRTTTVLQVLQEHSRQGANFKQTFFDFMVGKVVMTRYNNLCYKVDDIAWNICPSSTFDRNGTEMSFETYYKQQYGLVIKDSKQPLLMSRKKAKKNDPFGKDVLLSLVPEFCFITGLTEDITSNFTVMKDIVAKARSSPLERFQAIQRFVDNVNDKPSAKAILDGWGLSLNRDCVKAEGRVLPGPTLQFNPRYSIKSASADFSRDATSNRCFAPVDLGKWIVFCTQQDKQKADNMIGIYKQVAGPLGIAFGNGPTIQHPRSRGRMPTPDEWRASIRDNTRAGESQFVVIILPVAKDELYSAVKKQVLVETSIPSQVILAKTLGREKQLRSIMQKIALQINCKLGGSLWALNIPLKEHIMFVGVDSHHDPKRVKPSVLALVTSLDSECTKYYSRIVSQKPHQESADPLRPVFTQALAAFFQENHKYPDRIVVFRDGIGDGQLDTVAKNEVEQLKSAARSVCQSEPKFIFVVVQKRINERLFLMKRNQLENPEPGTVLDHTITRRGKYDFFLISQLVRQGAVGPSHYIVLEDSGENKPDLVQRFCYVTAFMYFNWPGTIRVPAMCQYAHKLAMLTGQHLGAAPRPQMEQMLYYL